MKRQNRNFSKKIVSLALAASALGLGAVTARAEDVPSPDAIISGIETTYDAALNDAGRSSFHGYCNLAVAYQLKERGIFEGLDYTGNGYSWYSHYAGQTENSKTSGGYYTVTYGGADCLYDLIEDYGDELYYIAYSLGTGGSSGSNHVMLITALIDNTVYFADSFSYGATREGNATALPIDEFINRYSRMNGSAHGCVYFTKDRRTLSQIAEEALPKPLSLSVETHVDGSVVTWHAAAAGGEGDISYVYTVYKDGRVLTTSEETDKNGLVITMTGGSEYRVAVIAHDSGGGADFAISETVTAAASYYSGA